MVQGSILAVVAAIGIVGPPAVAQPAATRPSAAKSAPGPGPEGPVDTEAVGLSSLSRLLHRFDFEEAQRAPYTMPFNFYRYLAPDQGFPRFGHMRLTNEVAHEGRWSFEFALDGGSMSARVPTAVIPVLPGGDYRVTGWIRTDGLTHARARLVAQLHDVRHDPIPSSRAESPLLQTGGDWRRVSVELFGDYQDAADLVIELELLQPQQISPRGERVDGPRLDDVTGHAWFDDVTVWQQPRIEISTNAPGNVVTAPEVATLSVLVRDPTDEQLTARLRIEDLDGRPLRQTAKILPQGSWRTAVMLDGTDHGWYRAVVEVRNDEQEVGRRSLDFAVVPARQPRRLENRFGVVIDAPAVNEADVTRYLVQRLGVSSALLPLPEPIDEESGPAGPLGRMSEDLIERDVELTIALPSISRDLATQPDLDAGKVLEAFRNREGLRDLLMRYGLEVPRWLLAPSEPSAAPGALGSAVLIPDRTLGPLIAALAQALSEFVPEPVVLVPWSAEYEPAALPAPHGFWMSVPTFIQPESLAEYASHWPIPERPVHTTLQRLDARQHTPNERVIDLMLRALHGWRAGLPRMAITTPWSRRGHRAAIVPDPAMPVWPALADRLDGRRFEGELPVGDEINAWILAGPGPDDMSLVAWSEGMGADGPGDRMELRMLLAGGRVEVVDAFGNRRAVEPLNGTHVVQLGPRPVFVEGVDPRLTRFRAGLEINPAYIAARHRMHEGELVLNNPWNDAITGTVRLQAPAGWRITPRIHHFSIAPREQARLPISLVFSQRVLTGRASLEAHVELAADREYRLRARLDMEIGMRDVEFAAHWRLAGGDGTDADDLIIEQHVTNTGDEVLNLVAYLSGPGIARQRRAVGGLQPGQTAMRSFRVTGGALLLAGTDVHIGVIEQGGARLNRVLSIPQIGDVAVAGHPQSQSP